VTARSATRKDALRSRRAILDAAADLLRDRDSASFAEIAHAAGVGQATVYRHFADHRALLTELAEESMDRLEERFRAEPLSPASFEALVRLMVSDQLRLQGLMTAIRSGEVAEEQVERLSERARELLREPLAEAIAAGLVRGDVTVDDAVLALAMIDGALAYCADKDRGLGEAERAIELALIGLGATPSA
jgi:AcrR family transcriptional regulator